MALISCPECGHQVSTAADACPACGFPVSKMVPAPALGGYSLELQKQRFYSVLNFHTVTQKLFNFSVDRLNEIVKNAPAIIADDLPQDQAKRAFLLYRANGVPVRVLLDGQEIQIAGAGEVCCPFCGSQRLQGKKQGFGFGRAAIGAAVAGPVGLLAGGIGSKNDRYTCLDCGVHGIKFD